MPRFLNVYSPVIQEIYELSKTHPMAVPPFLVRVMQTIRNIHEEDTDDNKEVRIKHWLGMYYSLTDENLRNSIRMLMNDEGHINLLGRTSIAKAHRMLKIMKSKSFNHVYKIKEYINEATEVIDKFTEIVEND
jgi:hypothetical protein